MNNAYMLGIFIGFLSVAMYSEVESSALMTNSINAESLESLYAREVLQPTAYMVKSVLERQGISLGNGEDIEQAKIIYENPLEFVLLAVANRYDELYENRIEAVYNQLKQANVYEPSQKIFMQIATVLSDQDKSPLVLNAALVFFSYFSSRFQVIYSTQADDLFAQAFTSRQQSIDKMNNDLEANE